MTLSVAILISLAVSLTTTPMMCALLLPRAPRGQHGGFHSLTERFFAAMLRRCTARSLGRSTIRG
jgi:multidrug efflux pump